jgi:hypothetical protein
MIFLEREAAEVLLHALQTISRKLLKFAFMSFQTR